MKSFLHEWTTFEKSWLIISTLALIIASIMWKSPWYGFVASISGMICVVLAAKGKISTYYFGIVNCIFYAYVAYGWQLYGEVMLNALYFLPMQFVGMYFWSRKDNKISDSIAVKFLSNKNRFAGILITIGCVIIYKIFLSSIKGNIPWIDSTSTILSIIAMILMAKLYMEQWVLWIIVDVVSIIMWIIVVFKQGSNDIGVLIMWTAFLVNAIYGFINWIKIHNEQKRKEDARWLAAGRKIRNKLRSLK